MQFPLAADAMTDLMFVYLIVCLFRDVRGLLFYLVMNPRQKTPMLPVKEKEEEEEEEEKTVPQKADVCQVAVSCVYTLGGPRCKAHLFQKCLGESRASQMKATQVCTVCLQRLKKLA